MHMYCVCTSRKCNDTVFQNIIYTSGNGKYILTITFLQKNTNYPTNILEKPFQKQFRWSTIELRSVD